MERLRTRFLNVNLDTVLHPIPNDVLKVVQSQQAAANKAKQVEQRILTAQEWFEQGKKLVDETQLEDAVQAFTKATELEGNFIEARENKVQLLVKLERKKEASKTVKRLIHSYEEQIEIERASYEVYREQWISGARSIYNSSIQDVSGYYDMEGLGPHSQATRFIQDREEKIKSLKTLSDELGLSE